VNLDDPNLPALESAIVPEEIKSRARATYEALKAAVEAVFDTFSADGSGPTAKQEWPSEGPLSRSASEALSESTVASAAAESRPAREGPPRKKFSQQRAPVIAQSPLLRMSPGVRQALLAMAADSGLQVWVVRMLLPRSILPFWSRLIITLNEEGRYELKDAVLFVGECGASATFCYPSYPTCFRVMTQRLFLRTGN
jgi:hypothetical protein